MFGWLQKKDDTNNYHYFEDWMDIWQSEKEEYNLTLKDPGIIPPVIEEMYSSQNYLKDGGRMIYIDNSEDLIKLTDLDPADRCVISINSGLPIEIYLRVKKMVKRTENAPTYVITEIR